MKPKVLKKGDKVAIVSLSRGLLGEPFIKHELDLGIKRLKDFGLDVVVMPNALKGIEYLHDHPEDRASDLKQAFLDPDIKGIICAIGGDDTYKIIPYLMKDDEFVEAVKNNPKLFLGFSDATNNHLMLNKLGLNTFYGQAFIPDLAELDTEMLSYTKSYFEKLFTGEPYEIISNDIWYLEREDFSEKNLGTPRIKKEETHGFEVLNGSGIKTGKLYGGCLESLYDAYVGERYGDEHKIYAKYNLYLTEEEWKDKILFLETSEEQPTPEKLEKMLMKFKNRNIFNLVQGVIVGKPMDEKYYEEYKEVYKKVFSDIDTPVLYNVNFGHATPRCILPYNISTTVDYDNKRIVINENILDKKSVN